MKSEPRLTSWKEIAAHLDVTPRTVMRWQEEGLPVHRLHLGKRPAVYAFKSELDSWVAQRSGRPAADAEPGPPETRQPELQETAPTPGLFSRHRLAFVGVALAAVIVLITLGAGRRAGVFAFGPDRLSDPVMLTHSPGVERSPAVSPDGSRVAFVRQRPGAKDSDVFILDLETGSARPLAAGPSNEFAPAWSPDGKSILYVREKLGTRRMLQLEAVLADADSPADELGTGGRVLTELSRPVLYYRERMLLGPYFAWASDGRSVILPGGVPRELSSAGSVPPESRGLFRLDVETRRRTRLTRAGNIVGGDTEPALSPDGRWLAFVRRFHPYYSELFLLDLESPALPPRQLTSFGKWVMTPRFADGGRAILISAGEFGADRAIWSVDPRPESEPRRVASPPGNVYEFDVLPGAAGTTLVMTRGRVRADIWGVPIGGKPMTPARIVASEGVDKLPALSPDGAQLAFVSDRADTTEVWLSAADGSNQRRLTTGLGDVVTSLDWSPDGSMLATTSRRPDGRHVYTVDPETGEMTRLTEGNFEDGQVRWGPEGEWIYFASNRDASNRDASNRIATRGAVYRVPASGGPAEHVRKGLALDFSPDGGTTFVAPTNRRLSTIVEGKLKPLARIAEPQAFAPAGPGFFYLSPRGPDSVSLEYSRADGSRQFLFFHIQNSKRDLTVDPGAKLIRWSRAEQPESDLIRLRLE